MSTIQADPIDLTEHVFRSVRGWLHQLYPEHVILIERRQDEALTPADQAAGTSTAARPIWRLAITTGPTWVEHTAGSHMAALTMEITQGSVGLYEAQRAAGRIVANAARPVGRIPLHFYNLAYPQPPSVVTVEGPATLPAALQVAVAPADADGEDVAAPSTPVALSPANWAVAVTPHAWPAGAPLATHHNVYAAAVGQPLDRQATVPLGASVVLTELASGARPPTNLRTEGKGLRVDDVATEVLEADSSDGPGSWMFRATLKLTVQVPRAWPAELVVLDA